MYIDRITDDLHSLHGLTIKQLETIRNCLWNEPDTSEAFAMGSEIDEYIDWNVLE